jgi:hypothetical protein
MKYILLITIVLTFASCSVTKLVKKIKTPEIDNSEVQVIVPLTPEKPQLYQLTPPVQLKLQDKPLQHNQTNTVSIILGIIVLILCFFPLVLMYIGLLIEYIRSFITKIFNWTK